MIIKEKLQKHFSNICTISLLASVIIITGCCPFSTKSKEAVYIDSGSNRPYRTTYTTPRNIYFLQQELETFYNSGGYGIAMDQVGKAAMKALIEAKNTPGKLAIVFDIDETSLSNYKYEKQYNFGFSDKSWDKWVKSCERTAIKPSLALFNQAKKQGVAIFFITGTKEKEKPYYEKNLKKVGYSDWTKLMMEPNDSNYVIAEDFKIKARKKITEEGYRIIINIGDQYSDLIGGYADKAFKYPNPFYYIP